MSEPWFNASLYAWMPGTLYGVLGGMLGALTGSLAVKGKAKGTVLGLWGLFICVAIAFLCLSIVAFFMGQPYGIWYGFGLPGLLGLILFPTMLPMVIGRYRAAEQRKIQAMDVG